MKLIPIQMVLAATVVISGAVSAQTAPAPAPASPWSFNIALTSNYKFRGQDQDTARTRSFKPALQGGVDYAFSNGFYLGNWNSTVGFVDPNPANTTTKRANLEMDFYGGYKTSFGDWGFDIGLLQYYYPNANKANVTEAYIGTSYGPFSAKYFNTLSRGYFGLGIGTAAAPTSDGRGTQYLNFAFAKEVAPSWTVKASIGQTMYRNPVKVAGAPNFTDYSLGVSYDFGDSLSLAGYIQGASQKNAAGYNYTIGGVTKSVNRDTFILTLTKAF